MFARSRFAAFLLLRYCSLLLPLGCQAATVLVMQFHNHSEYSDLNWVGEGVADTLINELGAAHEIVFDRSARAEAMQKLSLRADADFTRATLVRLGQAVGADYLCFGEFEVHLPPGETQLQNSSIRVAAQFVDMRRLRNGPELSEAGKLSELSRLEEHLAYQSLKYLQPKQAIDFERFLTPGKTIRLDAQESYVRGLLSLNHEQRQKWFLQAASLDAHYVGPAYELGKLLLQQKQYAGAMDWLRRVPSNDPNYPEARFKLGLAAYGANQPALAAQCFREVSQTYPLSEVFNNLGVAEIAMNQPAIDDFHRALDSDINNGNYLFNLGLSLYKATRYDEAAAALQQAISLNSKDDEAKTILAHARRHEALPNGEKLPGGRLRNSFNETAFRQLKAILVANKGS